MDRKYKLLVASSLVSLIATGCSSYGSRGNTDPQTSVTGSGGYASQQASQETVNQTAQQQQQCGTCPAPNSQASNGRSQQWYIDQWNRQQQGTKNTTNSAASTKTTTTNGRSQQWYIDQYNRSQAAAKAKAQQAQAAATATQSHAAAGNGRSKQWYIDQWNRQQATAKTTPVYTPPKPVVTQPVYTPPKPVVVATPAPVYTPPKPYVAPKPYVPPKPYVAPAPAPAPKTTTQYIDYTGGVAPTASAPSNKSLYTGSYQQPSPTYKQYTPKTYTGGASSTTSTSSYTTSASSTTTAAPASNGSTYMVKKGDTVFEVMRQTGVYWKEIISMNNLQGPSYTIQPGQTLRLK